MEIDQWLSSMWNMCHSTPELLTQYLIDEETGVPGENHKSLVTFSLAPTANCNFTMERMGDNIVSHGILNGQNQIIVTNPVSKMVHNSEFIKG